IRKMIRLFKVKEQQKEITENAKGSPIKKQSAGELRLHKDISDLNLPNGCKISFINGKDDLMNFQVTIQPDEGYYVMQSILISALSRIVLFDYKKCSSYDRRGGKFVFTFNVPSIYPHEAPKVKCKTKVYHPNIDLEGNVCLNILREDWKPVLNINTIIYGLFHLFTQPNHEDPLNQEAAAVLRDDPNMFANNVKRSMAGGNVDDINFPCFM
ncbi:Ubiquitin-conjugating enzyme E2, partial [Dillenia turbinata]